MKKSVYLLIIVLLIPLVTACKSSNSLSCKEELYKKELIQTLNIFYNTEKTKVESADLEINVNLNEIDLKNVGCTTETKEECLVELEEKYNDGCNNLLEECEITNKNENGFDFKAKIKSDKLEEFFGDINTTLPINQMRYKIETKLGFTCE